MTAHSVAVFDFDGTIIQGDSVVALLLHARKSGVLSFPAFLGAAFAGLLYSLGLTDALTAKKKAHAFLAVMEPSRQEAFLQEFAKQLAGRAFPAALRQIESHRRRGDTVLICSASCECYMRYVAPLLQADALLCTPSAPDGSALGPNCRGEEKVRRLYAWLEEQGIPREAIIAAYGDSKGDAPILKASKKPVLVNARRSLARALPGAERADWK